MTNSLEITTSASANSIESAKSAWLIIAEVHRDRHALAGFDDAEVADADAVAAVGVAASITVQLDTCMMRPEHPWNIRSVKLRLNVHMQPQVTVLVSLLSSRRRVSRQQFKTNNVSAFISFIMASQLTGY